jgi:DNA-binding NarL/FixJ family response regulator
MTMTLTARVSLGPATPPTGGLAVPTRVLVVDDDDHVRDLVKLELSMDDRFEVCAEAPNGLVAVEMAMLHTPDAVILDHMMPMLDGLAALRLICRALPQATVVVFSSATDPQAASRALALGAAAFFAKERHDVEDVLAFLSTRAAV